MIKLDYGLDSRANFFGRIRWRVFGEIALCPISSAAGGNSLKGLLKGPLILGAIVILARIVSERMGAPHMFSASLSAVWLHTLIIPIYFAIRIGKSTVPKPNLVQFKSVLLYVTAMRAMLLVPYWMARVYGWEEPRFGGLSSSSPFMGFVTIPVLTGVFWILASILVGTGVGAMIIAFLRK